MGLRGWRITGVTAGVLIIVALVSYSLLGFTEELVRVIIRSTARISVTLFLLAFTASSLRTFFPSAFTTWQLQNRRYLGVSFALSHFMHLAALFVLGIWFPHPFLDTLETATIVGGGLAYVFLTFMTITSFAGPRRAIGERAWTVLHTTGSYYIWLIFFQSYLGRGLQDIYYAPVALALIAALVLRLARRFKRRTEAAVKAAA